MCSTIVYGYDALGRRTTVTDARGNVFTTVYDANGNVVKTLDAKGNTISETVFNSLNLPVRVTDAMGKSTSYTYNELGKVATITDPMNHCSVYAYDSLGRNASVQDAANNTSTVTYDLLGNVTRLAGPLGGATNYTYDDMGRLTSESTVSGGTVQYTYNELNIRKKRTNARGQVRQMFYDSCGRITGHTDPEGSVSYTYDANGNVLTVTDRNGVITRTYDALNRVVSCTDTNGNLIRYEYDEVGNLTKLIYPDNTVVNYAYDANRNLVRVTDWVGRVTLYTYDVNNRIIGVTKPDGSVVVTVYDNKQRVTSTVERTASGTVISGFEYTYDDLSRIVEEKVLSNSTKMCYTYDSLSRVTKRTVKDVSNAVLSEESFTYDAAGNITAAPNDSFLYDTNNRLTVFNGNAVSYDLDGNILSDGVVDYTYDSANRLVAANGHTYTYNAEDVRIRNLCDEEDTTYVYNTNCRLSQLLVKTTNGVATKYVYGCGLVGEEVGSTFKTYHFDCRGSTVAITDATGNITDTFAYDTYGNMVSRTGDSQIIFGYNGRAGVATDSNGLIYMRARYYAPEMRRFVNADIIRGKISNAITLNRFAYANGNPVSLVDPFGLNSQRATDSNESAKPVNWTVAVLVTDFSTLQGVGHSKIYFRNSKQEWILTEYTTERNFNLGVKAAKGEAQVYFQEKDVDVTDFYQDEKFVEGSEDINYVVLFGDFNDSVELARKYYYKDGKDIGRYNLFFSNCSDYTDALLREADLDGMMSQIVSEANPLTSVPVLREFMLSVTSRVDMGTKIVSRSYSWLGESIKGYSVFGDIAGDMLIDTGKLIDVTTNFVGDVVDDAYEAGDFIVDGIKDVGATVTNGIADGITRIADMFNLDHWLFR